VRQRQGNLDDAMQLYRHVLARDPKNLMALNNLSWLLAEQPDHLVEALSLIDRALEQDAHQSNLLDTKAMILFQQGQFPMAATLLDEVVAKPASDARFRFHRALVYERMHDLNRARESLSAAQSSGLNPAQLTPTERKLLAELEQAVAVLGIRTGSELTSSATQ
jgi:cellulose synthase operon protein C